MVYSRRACYFLEVLSCIDESCLPDMDGPVKLQVLPALLQRLASVSYWQSFAAFCQHCIACMLPPQGGLLMHRSSWPCPPIWHEAIEP